MKFITYEATPGLERYPEAERFRIFCSTHQRLMHEDQEYRRSVNRFRWKMIWPTLVFAPLWLLFCFLILPAVHRTHGTIAKAALCVAAIGALVAAQLFVTWRGIVTSFHMQAFQNEKVGSALRADAV